jgi:2-polyprenyl-3-methyl-5-hydroxy-6-metoxy-1,4-benzoquinol methylase
MTNYFSNLIYSEGIYKSKSVSLVNYPSSGNTTFRSIEDDSFWYRHRNNCIINAIDNFQPTGKIFDIGGGNGYVSKAIQDCGFEVALIEPDIEGVLNAKQRGIKNLVNSSFYDLEFDDNKLDNIALFDVLEHIDKDGDFIHQISLKIKQHGLVFITVPSYNSLYSLEDVHDGHFRRYLLSDLFNLLETNGFEVEYSTYFFTYLIIPMYLFRTLPTKLHLGKFESIETYKKKQDKSKYKNEHQIGSKIATWLLNLFHKFEVFCIKHNRKIDFGASCLIVARKE